MVAIASMYVATLSHDDDGDQTPNILPPFLHPLGLPLHRLLRPLQRPRHALLPIQTTLRIPRRFNLPYKPRRVPRHERKRRHILSLVSPIHPSHKRLRSAKEKENEKKHTLVTTAPAPTVAPLPILTFATIVTLPHIQQSSSTVIRPPISGPLVPFRTAGSSGCVPE